jgi:hypothetical protein
MPLQKAKRGVLFHKGLADGTDRFLLQPPAIDYAENLTLGKDGSFSKRYGFAEIAQVPPEIGDPFVIHPIGDTLHVVGDSGAASFADNAWSTRSSPWFMCTERRIAETAAVGGMGHVDMLPYYINGVLTYYVVAFEVREQSSSNPAYGSYEDRPKHVVVQSYDADGAFLSQVRIENARSPKLLEHPSSAINAPIVVYQNVSTKEIQISPYLPQTGTITGTFSTGRYVAITAGLSTLADNDDQTFGPWDDAPAYLWWTRLGGSSDGHARYQVDVDYQNQTLFLFYREDGTDTIHIARFSSGFNLEQEVTLATGDVDTEYEAFDIVCFFGAIYTMHAVHLKQATLRNSFVVLERRTAVGAMTQAWAQTVLVDLGTNQPGQWCRTNTHGGLALTGSGKVAWFVHDAGQAVDTYVGIQGATEPGQNVRDYRTGLDWGEVTTADGTQIGDNHFLPHHRLVTRPIYVDDDLFVAVQQWYDSTPYTDNISTFDNWANTLGSVRPKTTVVLRVDPSDGMVYPIASIDGGQSAVCEYGESEFVTHCTKLFEEDGTLIFANRVAIKIEDLSLRLDNSSLQRGRLGAAESPADALCRIHRIGRGDSVMPVTAAKLGDGLMLTASVPLWFDGRFFGEASPLDQPEIISVWDERMSMFDPPRRPRIGFGPDDNNEQDEGTWRKFQIILGYFDSHGNKHRSSPSSTVYVCDLTDAEPNVLFPQGAQNLNEATWQGKEVDVYFTYPLSMVPNDLEYFVELYASDTLDGDPQLVDTSSIDLSSMLDPEDVKIRVQLVRSIQTAGSPLTDIDVGMPPRTSEAVYTVGGVLAADTWPSFTKAVATSTRLWVIDSVRPGRVIPSKLFEDYVSPEYNSTLAINLGDERNLTAIGKLDDKVVVFERDDIHVIYGDGPDNRGEGEDFAVHYISTDVGCQDQESVIETPAGLIFYSSPRGFYLLDRNLQIQFIGAAIEDIAKGIRVKAATIDPGNAEVRFLVEPDPNETQTVKYGPDPDTTAVTRPPRPVFGNELPTDACLAFFYETGDWMLYSSYPGTRSCVYQRAYTKLLSDGTLWQESEEFADPTGINRTLMRSPWISLSDTVQDYQRLWKILFLGRYLSSLRGIGDDVYEAGDIIVRLYFDYEATYVQEKRFRMQDFGFDPFNRTPQRAERLQFEISPQDGRGRCQAVKIEIEEVNSEDMGEGVGYGLGHGFEIVSAELHMGVAPSMRALIPAAVKQ